MPTGKKFVKVWSVVVGVEVAAVVVATMAELLVSPLTLYTPSTTVLIYFILKLFFPENEKTLNKSKMKS